MDPAEQRARELLRAVVDERDYEAYERSAYISVAGRNPRYGYLVYPHRPIVTFDTATGELLNEYCVGFRRRAASACRPPTTSLAKWMALRADEHDLITEANMHLPGRQVDPDHVRRDIARLARARTARLLDWRR